MQPIPTREKMLVYLTPNLSPDWVWVCVCVCVYMIVYVIVCVCVCVCVCVWVVSPNCPGNWNQPCAMSCTQTGISLLSSVMLHVHTHTQTRHTVHSFFPPTRIEGVQTVNGRGRPLFLRRACLPFWSSLICRVGGRKVFGNIWYMEQKSRYKHHNMTSLKNCGPENWIKIADLQNCDTNCGPETAIKIKIVLFFSILKVAGLVLKIV